MSITIAIGNDPIDIKRIKTLKNILDEDFSDSNQDIVDIKNWISDIYNILTSPTAFLHT